MIFSVIFGRQSLLKRFFVSCSGACFACVFLVACAPQHTLIDKRVSQQKSIPEINRLVSQLKTEYIKDCYQRLADKKPPLNACESQLFDMAERRGKRNYTLFDLDNIANEVFFTDYIRSDLNSLVRTNRQVGAQVKSKFSDQKDLLEYYRKLYSFHARE
jgi:hypothetical protein